MSENLGPQQPRGPQPQGPQHQGPQGYSRPFISAPAPRKEPFFSLVASFFIPGLGTILNGQTTRGAIFMACFYLGPVWALVVSFLSIFLGSFVGYQFGMYRAGPVLLLVAVLTSIGLWFWSLIDAYRGAEAHNMRYGLH